MKPPTDPGAPEPLLDLIYNAAQKRDKNRHHWMYTEQSLVRRPLGAGFSTAKRCQYRQGRCPDLDRLDNRPEDSLFVEGVK